MARPMRRAARAVAAPVTSIVTNFCAPSPSRTICCARSIITASSARRKSLSRRSAGLGTGLVRRLLGRAEQHGVAGRGIAVDGDRVERAVGGRGEQRLQHRGGQCRVGEDIGEHRRHVGRDHARALGEAVDARPSTPSIVAVAVAPFGKVSVVMIARAAASQPSAASNGTICGKAPTIFSAGGGSPMTPVEEINTCSASQPSSFAVVVAVASTTSLPARPVKTLALPELTTMPRDLAARQAVAAPDHRRARRQRAREDAGDGAVRRQLGDHQIVAAG